MAESKRFYWIKLKTDFFNLDEIDFLLGQKNGCEYVVLYQMLCLKTANNNGRLCTTIGEMMIPFDVEKIIRETKYFDYDTVTIALELFKKLGLIFEESDGVFKISAVDEMVGSEGSSAQRVRKHRESKALQCNTDVTKKVLHCNTEIEYRDKSIEIRDKSIDKEQDIDSFSESTDSVKIPYQHVVDLFNSICISYPKVKSLSEARKKAIKARFKSGYRLEDFEICFNNAENSGFLKGKNNKNWSANFDWLIKDANMAKVLDGNYNEKQKKKEVLNTDDDFWAGED